ncbi:MAG: hypothetical protein WAV47_03935 [Blastocatellia bacterium]
MATSSNDQAPLLVVAALGRELTALDRADPDLVLLETGEGTDNAERQLETWLKEYSARAVLSIGFAGALSSSLKATELVIATDVYDSTAKPDAKLLSAAKRVKMDGPSLRFGLALTSHQILWQAESKRAFANSLPPKEIGFVDMESAAIARVCDRQGLPFLIARSITDLLDEDLPLDFNQYRDASGRVDSKQVMKAALLKPRAIKALLELQTRSRVCAERMAEFVRRLVPEIG